jgi:hypothetical protein
MAAASVSPLQVVLDAEASFTPRSETVPGDLRREWRLAALVILLFRCNRRSASLQQIQVLGRAMLNSDAREAVANGIQDPFLLVPVVRDDPAWRRAVELAAGLDLVAWTQNGRAVLTDLGTSLAGSIWADDHLLSVEKALLAGLQLTQAAVDRLIARQQ